MWSRAQLKDKARIAFKRNYWKVVLVSAIVLLFSGGATYTYSNSYSSSGTDSYDDEIYYGEEDDFAEIFENDTSDETAGAVAGVVVLIIVILLVALVVFVIAMAITLVLQAFIFNPLDVGMKRFFFKNLNGNANVKEVAFAYDNNYKNVAKTLFFRDLYITLWTLLFIIPGIVKSYEYRMMPYLLAENPAMPKEQAFAISKQMMDGQKWDVFVLDLSFLGWNILSIFTMGILSIFYVTPYINMTNAALYESLCYQRQWASCNQQPMEPVTNQTKES